MHSTRDIQSGSFEGGFGTTAVSKPWRNDFPRSNEPQLADYIAVVRRNKWLISGIFLTTFLLGSSYLLLATPVYRAEATLRVEPNLPDVVSIEGIGGETSESPTFVDKFYETQIGILQSLSVAEAAVAGLHPRHAETLAEPSRPAWWSRYWPTRVASASDPQNEQQRMVARLREGLTVEGGEDSELIMISYNATDPELSASAANSVANAYMKQDTQARLSVIIEANAWLVRQLDKLQIRLNGSEARLQAYKIEEGLLDTKKLKDIHREKLTGITANLTEVQTKRMGAEVLYNQIEEIQNSGGSYQALGAVLNDPVVQELKIEEIRLTREIKEMSTHYGAESPQVLAAEADLEEISRGLSAEEQNAVNSIEKNYEAAVARETKLNDLNNKLSKRLRNLATKEVHLAKLERAVKLNRGLLDMFMTRVEETGIVSDLKTSRIRVIDSARLPSEPYAPNTQRVLGLALLFGVFSGVGAAFLRENLDRSLKSSRDIEKKLGILCLGVVPQAKRRLVRKSLILRQVVREPTSRFTDAIGDVRTSMQCVDGRAPQVVAVTSGMRGEGKTVLSSNLAVLFSQLGPTLLLDADFRNAQVGFAKRLIKQKGLTDFASDGAELKACIVADKAARDLYTMPPGSIRAEPLEFFVSQVFGDAIKKLKDEYQTIIIDCPPVLALSDAVLIGRQADSVMLVVRAGVTTDAVAQNALRRLRSAGLYVIGATLSQADERDMASYTRYAGV